MVTTVVPLLAGQSREMVRVGDEMMEKVSLGASVVVCDALGVEEEKEAVVCGTTAVPLLFGAGVEFNFFLLRIPPTAPMVTAAMTMTTIRAMSRIQVDLRRPWDR